MRVERCMEIERPLQEVFAYVADVGNYPEWMEHVMEVRKEEPGRPRQGDRFVVAIRSLGRRFETPYERTAFQAERRYTDRAVGGPVPNQRWHCTFETVRGGTRVTRAVDVESTGVLKLLERQGVPVERSLDRLAQLMEGTDRGSSATWTLT